tara:strand:- start:31 stop:627 length:597 start_codon:yes stop_codon:yes gene_type:complete
MVKYRNTPTNGIMFSQLVNLGSVLGKEGSIKGWDYRMGSYLKNISQKIVLDLGCGLGSSFILFLKERGYHPKELIHLDANLSLFFTERPSNEHKLFYPEVKELFYDWNSDGRIIADAENIPLESRSVDIINQNMMFADNPELNENKAMGEINRILKKGGIYIDSGEIEADSYMGIFNESFKKLNTFNVYRKIKENIEY